MAKQRPRKRGATDLSPYLLREGWPNEEGRQLCERYVNRFAPRLLMIPDLSRETWKRLEIAACD